MYIPGLPYRPGDFNNDGHIETSDITALTGYVQGQGAPPNAFQIDGFYPAADVDGDCDIGEDDIQVLADYVFGTGSLSWCIDYPPHPANITSMDLAFVMTGGDDQIRGACCYDDGTICEVLTEDECLNLAGDYKGDATACLGDANGNSIDDICEGWNPGDPHKMHFPQLPDNVGWSVNATGPRVLVDDWICSETGLIKDVHFWGSWRYDVEGVVQYFILSIHSDLPADNPGNPYGYSIPDELLWEYEAYEFNVTPFNTPTSEGWYDPSIPEVLNYSQQTYYRYDVYLPEIDWFPQEEGTIYWLNISAVVESGPEPAFWGWKSSYMHWNDDADRASFNLLDWQEIYEPDPNMVFENLYLSVNRNGNINPTPAVGVTGYNDGMWYPYMNEQPTWYNVWFYDHPYSDERWKTVYIDMSVYPDDPQYETNLEIAINWSTAEWSLYGNPPGQPRVPPLPPLSAEDEAGYINRVSFFEIANELLTMQNVVREISFPNFNPEWISIDVRGNNFRIETAGGWIAHVCEPKTSPQSLDLAFVVTGSAPCDCRPGDADGVLPIDILDIVRLIDYKFKGCPPGQPIGTCPPPPPYPTCSGDTDCNCIMDILDIVLLIDWKFKECPPGAGLGTCPPPCSCEDWVSQCGYPIYKK